jgi:hypothetical protein
MSWISIERGRRVRRLGFFLIAATLLAVASAPAAFGTDRIFWGNGATDTISYANLDGSGGGGELNLSGATPSEPRGVAIDSTTGRIYWANQENATISYANLDGSGGGGELNISGTTPSKPHGLAIDPAVGRIYFANDNNTISYANLDGSGGDQLDLSGATPSSPYGTAIDPATGRIYWANRVTNTISYANLDGSGGGGELNTDGTTPVDPHGVAIDHAGGRIYWANADFTGFSIGYANLDGSGGGGLLNVDGAAEHGAVGLAIDPIQRRIYWGNLGDNVIPISYANLDGSGGGNLNVSGATPYQARFPALLRTPSGTGAPQIAGGSRVGSQLACTRGEWASDLLDSFLYRAPQSFGYQWTRGHTDIPGATGSSYTARAAGAYSCRVTAINQAGTTSQTSPGLRVREPKCKHLRAKLRRQKKGLVKAGSEAKRELIAAATKDTKKRLHKHGC